MKALAAFVLGVLLVGCSSPEVDLTIDNKTADVLQVWIERKPSLMIDLGFLSPGEPKRKIFEAQSGSTVSVYVSNVKVWTKRLEDSDPVPLAVRVDVTTKLLEKGQ